MCEAHKEKCINRWQDWRTGGIGQAFIERLPELCALVLDLNNHIVASEEPEMEVDGHWLSLKKYFF